MERVLLFCALLCLVLASLLTRSVGAPTTVETSKEDGALNLNPTKTGVGSMNCTTKDGRLGFCVEYTQCYQNGSIIKYYEPDQFELRGRRCPGSKEWCCTDDIITEEEMRDGVKKGPLVESKLGTKPASDSTEPNATTEVTAGFRGGIGCGVPTDGLRQLNSKDMKYGECPWCVALFRTGGHPLTMNTNGYFCSGSLIHPRVVLTAADCVKGSKGQTISARIGDYDLARTSELFPHQEIDVEETVLHEGYNTGTKKNNIALLVLSKLADIQDNVNTACLPRVQEKILKPSTCVAGGWGKDDAGVYRDVLARVQLSPTDSAGCEGSYRRNGASAKYTVSNDTFCAEGLRQDDTCPAHHGAPFMCVSQTDSTRYVQYGFNSWTLKCGPNGTPGVYVDLAALRSWVDKQMSQRSFDTGTYTLS